MQTVDLDRLVSAGDRVLDVGCGEGRHAHAAALQDATVVGLDLDPARLRAARAGHEEVVRPTTREGETREEENATAGFLRGDARRLPVEDGAFDVVVCAEVLEHLPDYEAAIAELDRALAPGGSLAVSVPRAGPERVCWTLSDAYHRVEGGHVRIFDRLALQAAVERRGLRLVDDDHAHAFHVPYWWLRCLFWDRAEAGDPPALLDRYEQFLEWAEFEAPPAVAAAERALDPLLGKSLVLYFHKP